MPNTQQSKMEDMSEAYLRALCAANGFSLDRYSHDNDGADVLITCKHQVSPDSKIFSTKLDIQLKSSYSKIICHEDGSITFPLEVKNYNTLIQSNRLIPQILVVFHMYEDESLWLEHTENWLKITKCAYWINLSGKKETENKTTININIPAQNILNQRSLFDIMNRISKLQPI